MANTLWCSLEKKGDLTLPKSQWEETCIFCLKKSKKQIPHCSIRTKMKKEKKKNSIKCLHKNVPIRKILWGWTWPEGLKDPAFFFFYQVLFLQFLWHSNKPVSRGNFSVKKYTLWPGSLCLASLQKKEASPLSKASLGWMYEGQERRTFCFSLGELGWDILCGSHGLSESKKD